MPALLPVQYMMRAWFILTLISTLLLGSGIETDAAPPELESIFPISCQRGQTTEIRLKGKNLKGLRLCQVNHQGISVKVVKDDTIAVTAAADVPAGDYDLRLLTSEGLSNPRKIHISASPAVVAEEKSDDAETATAISLPGVADARFNHTADVDWFQFSGKAEQHVSIQCRSATLDGSAQPLFALLAPNGDELVHSPEHSIEPVVHYKLPVDGSYRIKVIERAYRKDNYSFYQLSLSTGPRLLAAFPWLISSGGSHKVSIYGFHLPAGKASERDGFQIVTIDLKAPDKKSQELSGWFLPASRQFRGFWHSLKGVQGNARFTVTELAVAADNDEANDTLKNAQAITPPCEIAGRFRNSRDLDWYKFSLKKGESLSMESFGDRLGQMMDLDLSILDTKGKLLTTLKDIGTPKGHPAPLAFNSLDAKGTWKSPADGEYTLLVRDLYGVSIAGVDRQYRVRLQKAEPDFVAYAYPLKSALKSGVTLYQGGHAHHSVFIDRQQGVTGPVIIRAVGLPPGISAEEQVIPAGQPEGRFSLLTQKNVSPAIHSLQLQAVATLNGKEMIRDVQPVTSVRSGLFRLDHALVAGIADPQPFVISLKPQSTEVVAGSTVQLNAQLQAYGHQIKGAAKLKWNGAFADTKNKAVAMSKPSTEVAANQTSAKLQGVVPANVKPGVYSLWLSATAQVEKSVAGKSATKNKPFSATAITNIVTIKVVPPKASKTKKK